MISHRGVSLSDSVALITGQTVTGSASFNNQNVILFNIIISHYIKSVVLLTVNLGYAVCSK